MPIATEIYDIDYNRFIHILGTAHFTKRSLKEAHEAVETTGTKDLAVELDPRRFSFLNGACHVCPKRGMCTIKCEFIEASETLGNMDANIWLIDMSENQIRQRIRQLIALQGGTYGSFPVPPVMRNEHLPWLWESGFKNEVIRRSQRNLEVLRRAMPPMWRVFIKERNALMAARLAWITSKRIDEGEEEPNILALVGAAHVEEIRELLNCPLAIRENMQALSLSFSPPAVVRRVRITGD
jgi:hypothetical protein